MERARLSIPKWPDESGRGFGRTTKNGQIERGGGKELASFVMHSSGDFCHAFLCRLACHDSAKRFPYRVVEVVSAVVEYLD